MKNYSFKLLTFLAILILFYSCAKTTSYLAPQELNKAVFIKEIIITMNDGKELKLKNPSLEKDKLIGYTEEGTKKEVALELIQSVRVEKANKWLRWPEFY